MEIRKGVVKYKDRSDIVCTYATTDDGRQYYFLDANDEKRLANGNIIASKELVEAIDPMVQASNIGVIDENGNEVIPFDNKAIKSVNNDIILVEKAQPVAQSVIDAIALKNDPLSAAKLVSTSAAIKDKLNAKMGAEGRYVFNDQFSEATVCDINGNNLVNNEYFSFIGMTTAKLYFSKNTVESEIVEYSILPPEVQSDITPNNDTNEINISTANVSADVVENALNSEGVPALNENIQTLGGDVVDTMEEDDNIVVESSIAPTDVQDSLTGSILENNDMDKSTLPLPTIEEDSTLSDLENSEIGVASNDDLEKSPLIPNVSFEDKVTDVEDTDVTIDEETDEVDADAPADEKSDEVDIDASADEESDEVDIDAPADEESDEVDIDAPADEESDEVDIDVTADEEANEVDTDVTADEESDEVETDVTADEESNEVETDVTAEENSDEVELELNEDLLNVKDENEDLSSIDIKDDQEDRVVSTENNDSVDNDLDINFDDDTVPDIDIDFEEDVDSDQDKVFKDFLKADKIVDFDDYSDTFDTQDYKQTSILPGKDTIIVDVAKSMTSLIDQNKEQKNRILQYQSEIKKLHTSRQNIADRANKQEQKIDLLTTKITNMEAMLTKLESKNQVLESRVRDQESIIANQSHELDIIRPQLEGKEDLVKLLADAKVLLGQDDYSYDTDNDNYYKRAA